MKYRQFGSLDWKVSALGFGAMRFPVIGGDSGKIDEKPSSEMLYYAIDNGVNYIDTAYPYHSGQSEGFVGKTLQGVYRDKVKIATKLPCWEVENKDDFDRLFNKQLERLKTDQVDFYLLHALNEKSWLKMEQLGVLPWAEKALADGKIAHLGFSFHDEFPVFKTIIDAYDRWEFCQIQYNYMDIDYQAGKKGLDYAAEKGLAVVVMEPIRGGRLVDPPQQIEEIWNQAKRKRTPADWSLQWLWNQPEVSVVLSGMSEMKHVVENVASGNQSAINNFSQEDSELVVRVRGEYEGMALIQCTGCGYCVPCPEGIDIPRLLNIYNDSIMYEKHDYAKTEYNKFVPEKNRANLCASCLECEEKCPQEILVSEWMVKIDQIFAGEVT
ncbi:MAG: aldo/keto reductase [Anaerolineales bacterium]